MSEQDGFREWCIVEIMGHQKYAGLVSEQVIGGSSFIRVDVPAVKGVGEFTKLFGPSTIYAITPTTEQIATETASQLKKVPVAKWDLPSEWFDSQKKLSFDGSSEGEYEDGDYPY